MCSQARNSCAKAFDNRSRIKNLKPKKSRGGVNLTPPPPPLLKATRVKKSFALSERFLRKNCYPDKNTGPITEVKRVFQNTTQVNYFEKDFNTTEERTEMGKSASGSNKITSTLTH